MNPLYTLNTPIKSKNFDEKVNAYVEKYLLSFKNTLISYF